MAAPSAPPSLPSPLTTHVLDSSAGVPARGMVVVLARLDVMSGIYVDIATRMTIEDGRAYGLIEAPHFVPGTYRLRFKTGDYFAAQSKPYFYPYCDVVFTVSDVSSHYHVPLIVSPFGYSTYRGS